MKSSNNPEIEEIERYKTGLKVLPLGELIDKLFVLRLNHTKKTGSVTEKALSSLKIKALKDEINEREFVGPLSKRRTSKGYGPGHKTAGQKGNGVSSLGNLF